VFAFEDQVFVAFVDDHLCTDILHPGTYGRQFPASVHLAGGIVRVIDDDDIRLAQARQQGRRDRLRQLGQLRPQAEQLGGGDIGRPVRLEDQHAIARVAQDVQGLV
jgi:hypothetical protein